MMTYQQLTTVCIFMTTYQIAPAQQLFNGLVLPGQTSLLNNGLLPRPPKGYHFETLQHILNTYPSNSYTIRRGLSNIIRNNKRGNLSPKRGSNNSKKKSKKKNKPKNNDQSSEDFPLTDPSESPAGNSSANPPTATPPAGTPPPNSAGVP